MSSAQLQSNLCRLAQFGANIADAHSCFIFLPTRVAKPERAVINNGQGHLELTGFHSLSNDIVTDCLIDSQTGLIGWVAKHARSIHVSPFDRDSRTLGIYAVDQLLKSFIGIPVRIERGQLAGVIACDSRKSFAFSKLQGKLLENLSEEVSSTVRLLSQAPAQASYEQAFHQFLVKAKALEVALGSNSLHVFRLKLMNFPKLESALGTVRAFELVEQLFRLIIQALPPHFPAIRLPHGHIVAVVDNMMSSFYESKVRAMCDYTAIEGHRVEFEFSKEAFFDRRRGLLRLEDTIAASAGASVAGSCIPEPGGLGNTAQATQMKAHIRASFYELRRA